MCPLGLKEEAAHRRSRGWAYALIQSLTCCGLPQVISLSLSVLFWNVKLIIKLTSLGWLQDSSEKLDAKRLYNWFYWSSGGRERSLRLGENSLAQPQNFTVLALLKKPDATEHSLIIENDESVFDARVVTFFQECRLLWAPGSSAGDYFWGWEHCALLARFVKPRPLVVIEESGSAFAMVGARH